MAPLLRGVEASYNLDSVFRSHRVQLAKHFWAKWGGVEDFHGVVACLGNTEFVAAQGEVTVS